MAIELNCACDCPFEQKTLLDLYNLVRAGLGFIDLVTSDPAGASATPTLAELRGQIRNALGLATPMPPRVRTAIDLIDDMAAMLGMAGQGASYAPGFKKEALAFLNKAQQAAFRRIELDNGVATPPAKLVNDSDPTSVVDCEITLSIAMALNAAQKQKPDAKAYADQAEKMLADWIQRNPPNMQGQIDQALMAARRTVLRALAQGAKGITADGTFAADGDHVVIDPQPVYLLALANLKMKAKQGDAQAVMQEYNQYMSDQLKRSPANAPTLIRQTLKAAQERLFRTYGVFRMERWFTWTLVAGQRFYGIGENDPETSNQLTTPTNVDATLVAGGSLPESVLRYRITAIDSGGGETLASATHTIVTASPNRSVHLTWDEVTGAVKYGIYGFGNPEQLLHESATNEWTDVGGDTFGRFVPTENTTGMCLKRVDPREVTWVGVSQDSNSWRPLRKGVPPYLYASPQVGVPTHYDIRQCIEVWPSPQDGWELRIKGKFGLGAFDVDADLSTIDWQAIYLQALADCKASYNMPDAQLANAQARTYVGDLVAGTHMTARYVPGVNDPRNAVRPILLNPDIA